MNQQKQSGISSILITLIIVGVLVGGGLIWYYQKTLQIISQPTPQITFRDETADWQTYRNEEYGFEVRYPVDFELLNQYGETYLSFPAGKYAQIYISAGKDLSVSLPGTFGGRYQYTKNQSPDSKVFSEKDAIFNKDYFIAYGGMGSWDTVINAYQYKEGNYYIFSLYRGRQLGSPGTESSGKEITKQGIIDSTLNEMRDKNNEYVKIFNQILSTFKFIK